ncbi:late embryogenesis abundant protein Dc3-like [Vigna radiata var. radiata]|uniref:Late embryogenesis abundant protein Dc3-like n=1 Tax=Vigna radiata var. radiata TaxID=3916 RepID=A0A1S3VA49_VIGRR|nr:late embryogenesis abundant protein Dc3-like [Vigna radiata var. radiata]
MASGDESYIAGETNAQIQEKTKQEIGQVGQKAQEKSDESKERASEMGRCMKKWAQYGKENTCWFLQGISESVKNSFGMAPQNDEDEEYYYYYYPTQNSRE